MLRRQVWMADDDEFDHIVKNSQRVLRLNDQYKNHPYVEEFTKGRSVMFMYGTYVLEGETDAKFSLDDMSNLFQGDTLPNNASNFYSQMINCMKARDYQQKNIRSSTEHRDYQASTWGMEDEKYVLAGEYRQVTCVCKLSYFCTRWLY